VSKKKKEPVITDEPLHRVEREELKKIASALFGNQLFTTFHIRPQDAHLASSIFMPILFMESADRKRLEAKKPHVFTSMKMLVKEDWDEVVAMAEKLKETADKL
jgi:hypothetical protein